jgi:C1A family cysteine protease
MVLNNYPDRFMELSELYHYYYARQAEKTFPKDAGQNLRTACATLINNGVALEYTWKYDVKKYNDEPSVVSRMFSKFYKVSAYRKITVFDEIIPVLATGTPVIIGIDLHESFYKIKGSNITYIPTGAFVGGHAVYLTGYDKDKQCFSVRNSWGPTFGLNGNFLISFDVFKKITTKYGWYVVELDNSNKWLAN